MPEPQAVQSMFSRIASRYDLLNRTLSLGIDQRWRRRTVREAGVDAGDLVVDVCTGTGDLAIAFARAGARVVGVDFTYEMVRRSPPKVRSEDPATVFVHGDALRLPLADGVADIATVAFGIRNVADRRAGLREMARVVRPGGRVLVLEFTTPRRGPFAWAYRTYFTQVLPRVGRLVSKDSDAYEYLPRTVLAWPDPDAFQAELEAEGLVECGYARLTQGIACLHWGMVRRPGEGGGRHVSHDREEEWEWEDEEWDEESSSDSEHEPFSRASLAVGGLAMVPLLVIYELALAGVDGRRSTAELVLFALPTHLGWPLVALRWTLLLAVGLGGAVLVARSGRGLVPPVLGVMLEGVVGALVLGPVLVGLMHLLREVVPLPALGGGVAGVPALEHAGFVLGAAAWEEVLFRLGLYGALYFVGRRLTSFFGAGERFSAGLGEALGLFGSAAAFAALHLSFFTGWLGEGGEAFEASAFTWRFIAGILLGLLFRWRGAGVAAWTHGLFNLALLLGAGPDVFVGPY